MDTHDEARFAIGVFQRSIQRFAADIIPVATERLETRGINPLQMDSHIDRTLLLQDIGGLGRLVVEDDVRTEATNELALLLRAGGRNDLEAL